MASRRESQDEFVDRADALGLHDRGYLKLLLVSALVGIPLSAIAFGFLVAVHELEHVVWDTLPTALGYAEVPAWWPIVTIGLAGLLVALTVKYLPGHGGHLPADGFGGGATPPSAVPGVVLAAGASLVGGAVLGPEAPLVAIGGGLALLAIRRTKSAGDTTAATIISAAGAAAAISAIFGNPLVAAVIFLEILGLGRRRTMLVVIPCLVASGVGALLFTGLGRWTGLEIGALSIPDLEPTRLAVADVVWALPLAAVTAVVSWAVFRLGRRTARLAARHLMATTVGAGVVAGGCACVYALVTGHPPGRRGSVGSGHPAAVGHRPGGVVDRCAGRAGRRQGPGLRTVPGRLPRWPRLSGDHDRRRVRRARQHAGTGPGSAPRGGDRHGGRSRGHRVCPCRASSWSCSSWETPQPARCRW